MNSFADLIMEQTKSLNKVQQTGTLYGELSALVGLRVIINEKIKQVEKQIEENNKDLFK